MALALSFEVSENEGLQSVCRLFGIPIGVPGMGGKRSRSGLLLEFMGMFGGKLASDPETDLGQELQVSCQTCPSDYRVIRETPEGRDCRSLT